VKLTEAIAKLNEMLSEHGDVDFTLLNGDDVRAIRYDDSVNEESSGTVYVSNIGD
jgi:hypothetical protein